METQQPADNPKPTPTPAEFSARSFRGGVGAIVGCFLGGMIGWLIDSAFISQPYIGVRLGLFIGGLLGGVVYGSGTGWRGAVLVFCMVGCMTAGAFAGNALWPSDPNSFFMVIPIGIGVSVGMLVGIALSVVLYRALFRPLPVDKSPA